jgi:hypothetical protein
VLRESILNFLEGISLHCQQAGHNQASADPCWRRIRREQGRVRQLHGVNAGEILQQIAGAIVQHGRKQEGSFRHYRSCVSSCLARS